MLLEPLAEDEELLLLLLDEEPSWAPPVAVDSLALRSAAAPVNSTALTPVLFLQVEGSS